MDTKSVVSDRIVPKAALCVQISTPTTEIKIEFTWFVRLNENAEGDWVRRFKYPLLLKTCRVSAMLKLCGTMSYGAGPVGSNTVAAPKADRTVRISGLSTIGRLQRLLGAIPVAKAKTQRLNVMFSKLNA